MSALTAAPATPAPSPDIARKRGPFRRIADVWVYRELLLNLTRKELKVKYKNSVLGFLWSLLNPLLYLIVYYVVFQYFLKTSIPVFAVFLLRRAAALDVLLQRDGGRHHVDRGDAVWWARCGSPARSCRWPPSAPRWCTSSCSRSC